ncbi:helix-turn-helix transcriptional regulator [Streptomyces sp. NPDC058092]|uniref:helix-turn-helix transcriptional regulator n=1 Tax=Streptomyces sp. NPDC058092 TaxID=3346336 RepID=UPI0036E68A81
MKHLDPGASPQEWFGNELRKLRLEHGLSAKALGRLVQVSDDMILSIEKGKYPSCRHDVAQRLDDVLRTGGLFDRAWPMVFGNRDADKKQADADKARATSATRTAVPSNARRRTRDAPPGFEEREGISGPASPAC